MLNRLKNNLRGFSLRNLHRNISGVALTEFAYVFPVMMGLGTAGIEIANLAMVNQRISQITTSVADNGSRAKQVVALSLPQLREFDINDIFAGAGKQSGELGLLTRGRVIMSSLQNEGGKQIIKWQRCKGLKVVSSSYGPEGHGISGPAFAGFGPTGAKVTAEPGTAIIFVEIVYDYKPIITNIFTGNRTIRKEFGFYVRDDRDLTKVHNPSPMVVKSECNIYSAT